MGGAVRRKVDAGDRRAIPRAQRRHDAVRLAGRHAGRRARGSRGGRGDGYLRSGRFGHALGEPREYLWAAVLSNDERKIAYNSGKSPNKSDVWIYDRERGTNTRLTFEQGMCAPVAWSPDDSELAVLHFTPTGTNVFTTSFHHTDGSGPSREPVMAGLISFDARWENAAVQPEPAQKESAIRAVRLNDPETFTTVIHSEHLEFGPQLSPDGTLLAYISTESGERNLYCTSFPSGHGKWLISDMPVESSGWSADGSAIYFTTKDSRMMRVGVERPAVGAIRSARGRVRVSPFPNQGRSRVSVGPSHQRRVSVSRRAPQPGRVTAEPHLGHRELVRGVPHI